MTVHCGHDHVSKTGLMCVSDRKQFLACLSFQLETLVNDSVETLLNKKQSELLISMDSVLETKLQNFE